jgi:putative cardiolipin synthase
MLMLRAAEHSLDLPHCIWRNDLTGALLFDTLREAADRGVRVRLLPETAPDTLAALAERAARSLDSPGGHQTT